MAAAAAASQASPVFQSLLGLDLAAAISPNFPRCPSRSVANLLSPASAAAQAVLALAL